MKSYTQFINEYQSVTKPIENSTNPPRYNYMNAADILANKHNITVEPSVLKEFEESVVSKLKEGNKPKNDDYYAKLYKEYKKIKYNDTPPTDDDTISNLDYGKRAFDDEMAMKIENGESILKEDGGVATATAGAVSGMGAVISAQPSNVPGQTMGSNTAGASFGDGGVVGSGDVAVNRNVIKRPEKSRRKKREKSKAKEVLKNFKNAFKGNEYKQGGDKGATKAPTNIMSFSDFSKKK